MELRGSAGSEKVLFLQKATFVRQPAPASGANPLPAGKSWVSAGLNEKQSAGSALPQFVNQLEVVNTRLILEEIKWGAVAAQPLGRKQIGTATAQGYAITVNLRRAQSETAPTGPTTSQLISYQIAALASTNSTHAAVRVAAWIGPSGQIVQVEWSPPGAGVGRTSFTLSPLHARLDVRPPPPSQTVDVVLLGPAGEQEGRLGDIA
jgi:hypothetical protein